MAVKITDKDFGYKRILKEFKTLKTKPFVKVGYLAGPGENPEAKTEDENGTSLILIASSQEFGTETIPARPTLFPTEKKERENVMKLIKGGSVKMTQGSLTLFQVLSQVGIYMQGQVQEAISDLTEPALAESTIQAKGSTKPLIDQGTMRQSVNHKVVTKGGK